MKYALVIGNTLYTDSKLAQLKTPEADSIALANILRDTQIGDFDSVKSIINESDFNVRVEISSFFSNKKPDDLLVLYFSGHGVLDERGHLFLALKNTQTNILKATAISSSFISEEMDTCRSKRQILILDCCNSGAFERGTKGSRKAVTETTFKGNGYGRVVLTATNSTQYAFEGNQIIPQSEFSLFTHFLIGGLQSGEADLDEDGNISLDELYDYAYEKIIDVTPKQVPQKWSYHQQGTLIVAKNPQYELAKREAEERARKEKAEKERIALENKTRKEAEEKARLESEERARVEIEERERIDVEAKARKEAEEKARREAEERARIAKEENDRKTAEIAEQEKEKREVAEKAKRERIERESVEEASQEKAKLQAIEKVKREREERHAAQLAALKETFSRSFATLKSNLPKAKPLLRNVGLAGIAVVLFWFSKLEIPKLASLVPTATASLTSTFHPSVTFTFTVSPQLLTKTLTGKSTSTLTPTLAPTAIGGGAGKIAFTSERDGYQEIYVMNSDSSDLIKLKNSITPKGDPAWSPDGKQIVFASNNNDSASLYIMNVDGSNPTKLIDTKELSINSQATSAWRRFSIGSPVWSPDGKKIVFKSGHYVGCCLSFLNIFIINADGSNLISVANHSAYDNEPAWSPDSQKIAFDSGVDWQKTAFDSNSCGGSSGICMMNADGTDSHPINQNGGAPIWSPDGKKIAFSSSQDGNGEVYVMNADGTNPINLTHYGKGWDAGPIWSPDGRKIAFSSYRDGNFEIYMMSADGTNLVNLTKNQAADGNPVWSPDSQKIAFVSERDGNSEIYVIDADGSNLKRLTDNDAKDYSPTWSP